MGRRYVPGEWNVICDVCGFEYKASELLERWDGQRVCKKDWEPRHVLDFFRPRKDHMEVAWARDDASRVSYYVANVTSSGVLTAATVKSNGYALIIDATSGNLTITLPKTTGNQFAEFGRVQVARTDATANTVTLAVQAPDTYLGSTSVAVGDAFELFINPSQWFRQT